MQYLFPYLDGAEKKKIDQKYIIEKEPGNYVDI